jgi:uncharacterized protein YdeI (YjbR/CyaY-like superfamily)
MPNTDPRVDAYISKAQPFARPILEKCRDLVHRAVPDAEETIKWGMPFFMAHGALLANMAAFKAHCSFGFWKATAMKDSKKLLNASANAMGHLGKLASVDDLPDDKTLTAYIKEAAKLNQQGVKAPHNRNKPDEKLTVPAFFTKALGKHKKAKAQWAKFPPGRRREYVMWLSEAKSEETRNKRLETALEWIAEGKSRNWKYEKK